MYRELSCRGVAIGRVEAVMGSASRVLFFMAKTTCHTGTAKQTSTSRSRLIDTALHRGLLEQTARRGS
jgi:hypothetical protein